MDAHRGRVSRQEALARYCETDPTGARPGWIGRKKVTVASAAPGNFGDVA
jgi:hypothetical protein